MHKIRTSLSDHRSRSSHLRISGRRRVRLQSPPIRRRLLSLLCCSLLYLAEPTYSFVTRSQYLHLRGQSRPTLFAEQNKNGGGRPRKGGNARKGGEDKDKRSKDRAMAALSQPSGSQKGFSNGKNQLLPSGQKKSTRSNHNERGGSTSKTKRPSKKHRSSAKNTNRSSSGSAGGGDAKSSLNKQRRRPKNSKQDTNRATKSSERYSSLLPPPLSNRPRRSGKENELEDSNDPLSSGLSSWEEFLGVSGGEGPIEPDKRKAPAAAVPGGDGMTRRLPSIQDLFPPDISSSKSSENRGEGRKPSRSNSALPSDRDGENSKNSSRSLSQGSLEGVLPVSDLFYRSSSSPADDEEHDDEELPFSAEQSDAVSSDNNKVRIRRNLAQQQTSRKAAQHSRRNTNTRSNSGRKMVRRGMEMLVGGVPINADPPQRSVELLYTPNEDWAEAVSLNSRDFGPLLYGPSIPKVTLKERASFTEFWARSALKWDICPPELREIVKSGTSQRKSRSTSKAKQKELTNDDAYQKEVASHQKPPEAPSPKVSMRGSGVSTSSSSAGSVLKRQEGENGEYYYETEGECTFEVGLTREEIESASSEIFESVFGRAFVSVIEKAVLTTSFKQKDFRVEIGKLYFTEKDDGYTDIRVGFQILASASTHSPSEIEVEKRTKHVHEALQQAMDDGEIALALAASAQEETSWPDELRDRVVEECLLQDDDETTDMMEVVQEYAAKMRNDTVAASKTKAKLTSNDMEGPFQSGSSLYSQEDLFLGGGNDGVFYDFSEANAHNSPYGGEIGLRLVEATVERAKQRYPRVIAIGDVHGCIDELQDLLRECDYRPGDLVVFLGDLVCKGPDSISVVQMAREIGAIGVRGNHDFEVVRWHQAIKSGVDPPVVGSEHFHIASCLNKADMKWMYSLPWFISSKELSSLFVHAGFVSGIRLAKQNPRLMMNMRSILPDGTVTSKFFNNWPWARLWDGPQTVFFGHDADRGLQQYEHAIGLDTGCVYGGRLTACILPEKRLVSVSARREYFKYRRKHYD